MVADKGFDDDGPEFREPIAPDDRLWRHPSEMGSAAADAHSDYLAPREPGRSPWTIGVVSVVGGVLLASSLLLAAGGVGGERGRIALRPVATLAPTDDDPRAFRFTTPAVPPTPGSPAALVGVDVHALAGTRMGNGLAADSPGYVVTTWSLVADALEVRVTDARGVAHAAEVVGQDPLNDVALLWSASLTAPAAPLGSGGTVSAGDTAYVAFASRGVSASVRPVSVRATDVRFAWGSCDLYGAIELADGLDASAAGAPLVTPDGRVLGLVTVAGDYGRAVVIPLGTVARTTAQLVATGVVRHGWLGIEGVTVDEPVAGGVDPDAGALVSRVVDDSPAHEAGLLANDVVVAVDGESVSTMDQLVVAVRERAPGSTVTVSVVREGARQDVQVALDEAPGP